MKVEPSFSEFSKRYAEGAAQLVSTKLIADLETPVAAMLKLAANRPYSFLLESVEGGAVRGRYSIIGLDPDVLWRAQGDSAEINENPLKDADAFQPCKAGTLKALRELLDASKVEIPEHLPPMSAGVFGYLSYDTIRLVEKLPCAQARSRGRARRVSDAARDHGHFRRREGRDDRRHHGTPEKARLGQNRLLPRRGAAHGNPGRARHQDRACAFRRWSRRHACGGNLEHGAQGLHGDGRQVERVHRGRRHLSGRAVAALPDALRPAAFRALPGASPRQPLAVPLFPELRKLRGRGLQP